MAESEGGLRRALGAYAITIYAVGDVLGAGIYALVGKVAGEAGGGAWISFAVSAVIALFTGLTYAELSSRFPVAAGAAAYARRAFPGAPLVAFVVGIFVLASGLTSAATVSRAFVGYLAPFAALPELPASLAMLALMSVINFIGIRESARVNFVLTLAEAAGLLLVIGAGFAYFATQAEPGAAARLLPGDSLAAILTGATLSFFAYIGFEDTVNVAEEVKDPARALPRAILTAIGTTCVIYMAVTVAALLTIGAEKLAAAPAPLLAVLEAAGVALPAGVFSLIALFAICNTGLLNLIMVSRLSYGMARENLLPAPLARVHERRRTPWVAVWVAFALAALLSASGGVKALAQATSLLLLVVFTVLHVGLLVIKRRDPAPGPEVFRTPVWAVATGALLCLGLAVNYPLEAFTRTAVVLAVAVGLYFAVAYRRRG